MSGPRGVRTASLTHSRRAVSAGTCAVLPGSVTVCCARPAFGFAKAFSTQGATLPLASSPIRRPWFGSSVFVAGGGVVHGSAAASGPGPETLRMFASKSSTSSKIAE